MGQLSKYGVRHAPSSVITGLLKGALDAWSYDYKNAANAFRDQSVRLRNLCDDALGQYTAQLQQELHDLRQKLPQPTRENPYPPMEGLRAVKELEGYIREIESIRVQVRSAVSPPNEIITHSEKENEQFLGELVQMDRELLTSLSAINEDTIEDVRHLLQQRTAKVETFTAQASPRSRRFGLRRT